MKAHYTPEQIAGLKWAAMFLLIIAAILTVFGAIHYRKATALLERGKLTSAEVVEVRQKSKRGITVGYELKVVFDADGERATTKLLADGELGARYWNGDGSPTVRIIYLPEDPGYAAFADPSQREIGHSDAVEPYIGFLLAGGVGLVGLFVLLLRRRLLRRA